MKADRNSAGAVSERHVAGDVARWVLSTLLAVFVVAVLLLLGMVI